MSLPVRTWRMKEKCPYCGKWFFPHYYKDENVKSRTCKDPKCIYEHKTRKRKEALYKIKKALLVAVTPENASVCAVCKVPFVKKRENQKTCGNLICKTQFRSKSQQERRELAREVKRLLNETPTYDTCQVCGKPFLKTMHNRKLCGSDECKRAMCNKRKKERAAELKETGFVTNIKAAPIPEEDAVVLKKYKKVTRKCLKCSKEFETDVMWICPACTRINENVFRWG